MESRRKTDSELGLFIYQSIQNANYTIEMVAELLEKSPRLISYYCSGQRKPSHRTLLRLIKVLNVPNENIPF